MRRFSLCSGQSRSACSGWYHENPSLTVRLPLNLAVVLLGLPALAQSNIGELHLKVRDPNGAVVQNGRRTCLRG